MSKTMRCVGVEDSAVTAETPGVRELLETRKAAVVAGESIDDGYRLGLAVEGGGMRAIISGAMLIALADCGMGGVFDGYYGTSAGALNLAYFCAGWRWEALRMYYDILISEPFISPLRAGRRKGPIVHIDMLFDQIMSNVLPLDYEKVLHSTTPLFVGASSLEAQKGVVLGEFTSAEQLRGALRAGSWLPLLAGGVATFNEERYLDGGLYYPHPAYAARDGGCTHVVALVTQPIETGGRSSLWHRGVARHLDGLSEGAGGAYLYSVEQYGLDRKELICGEGRLGDTPVLSVCVPRIEHDVTWLTRDFGALLGGARAGYVAAAEQLGGDVAKSPAFTLHLEQ
jgi:predicted patatin/cPLA2 family phospholipase